MIVSLFAGRDPGRLMGEPGGQRYRPWFRRAFARSLDAGSGAAAAATPVQSSWCRQAAQASWAVRSMTRGQPDRAA